MLAIQATQDFGNRGDITREGDIAEVINDIFRLHSRIPVGNQRFIHLVHIRLRAELRAEFGDIVMREMQVGGEVDIAHGFTQSYFPDSAG